MCVSSLPHQKPWTRNSSFCSFNWIRTVAWCLKSQCKSSPRGAGLGTQPSAACLSLLNLRDYPRAPGKHVEGSFHERQLTVRGLSVFPRTPAIHDSICFLAVRQVGVGAGVLGVKGDGGWGGGGLSSHVIKVYLTIDLSASTIETGFVAGTVRTILLYLQSWNRNEANSLFRLHNVT